MKILLSPAKKLDFSKSPETSNAEKPFFQSKTDGLLNVLRKKSAKQIGELMKLSPQLADLNYQRFQVMGEESNEKSLAGFAFNGEVYTGLDIQSFSKEDLNKAEDKLRILSGLYGILKPSTVVEPYRLEMGTKLVVGKNKNLYEYWGDEILNFIQAEEKDLIVNLASNEYNKAAKLKQFKGRVVTPNFKEFKNGDYKTIMVFAKKARGTMAKWIIQNDIEDAESIKNFTEDGYVFNEGLSSENDWVFTR